MGERRGGKRGGGREREGGKWVSEEGGRDGGGAERGREGSG